MVKKNKLRVAVYRSLCEALRRFEVFAVRRDGKEWTLHDLQEAWTGLGPVTKANYLPAVVGGFMERVHSPNHPYSEWLRLTLKGAEIVLAWHYAGYSCEENGVIVPKTPPTEYPFI